MVKRTKRSHAKKSTKFNTLNSVNKSNPFPKTFTTKLLYEENFDINPAAGGAATHLFRCGSVFDPNFTGTGHQPRYFDEIMPLYDHFTVIGSKITVKVVNTTNSALVAGIQINGNGTAVTTVNNLIENRNSRYKWVGHQYSNSAIQTLIMSYSPKKFLGISNPMASENLRGTITANPAEDAYYAVVIGAHDPLINPATIYCRAMIEYIVVFTEPRTTSQS